MKLSRRDFFKQIFALSITTAACPHISLGRITPVFKDNGDDSLTGIFHIKMSDYPILKKMWGSVRIGVEGIPPEYHYPKIIVSRIDPDYWEKDFTTVSEACPHEGYPIELLNSNFIPDPLFECVKGHGSLYFPDGSKHSGVTQKDLEVYKTDWDGGDNLYIEIPALETAVIEENISELSYLSEFYPNPADDITNLKYGVEKYTNVRISLFDIKGLEVKIIVDGQKASGHYEIPINLSDLPTGSYICRMKIGSENRIVRQLQVVR